MLSLAFLNYNRYFYNLILTKMKKLLSILFAFVTMLLIQSVPAEAQSYSDLMLIQATSTISSPSVSTEAKIYGTTYGVTNSYPSQVVKKNNSSSTTTESYNVYNTTYGIKDISPTKVIERSGGEYKVYNTIYGIKEITPSAVIKRE